jgi:hypothetical protein
METYGANVQPATRVEGGRKGFLEQLFKFDTETAIDEEIGRPEYGQLSVSDINRLAAQPEYAGDPAAAAMVRLPEAPRDDMRQISEYFTSTDAARKRAEEEAKRIDPSDPMRELLPQMAELEIARFYYESPNTSDRLRQKIENDWGLQHEEQQVNVDGVPHLIVRNEDGETLYLRDMQGNYLIFNGIPVARSAPMSATPTAAPAPAAPTPAEPLTIPDYAAP